VCVEGAVVGDSPKLEGTGDAKQRPLELTVATLVMNRARRTFEAHPKDRRSETKHNLSLCIEPALLECLVWWSRCPVAKDELTESTATRARAL